ncbi:DUF3311 domain-containing protein [Bacillus sp. ISL-40]|uniref:DUF3311 domain-containing protein n=1 Tax=unclassified Bacillus (in: firmicutes) TaxID=185979 RepID=UPI001BE839D4|nr:MULTISPECIES: DUF3311 domain-containing protein [unclassified Bacillus (in: firmicutes)]MBT2695938.1 DUF3311 domain-containing protein [Bacillus sp. ISL-40]MBT2739706.1 DUF3311 domain-containing protein [Bacillus sp. ISL-77]
MGRKFMKFILIILPFISQLAVLPFVNRIDPIILGLPFLQFWLFLWIVLTPLCTFGIYQLQKSERSLD